VQDKEPIKLINNPNLGTAIAIMAVQTIMLALTYSLLKAGKGLMVGSLPKN